MEKESTPQSFKAVVVATVLMVLLLNMALLLPVSPVRAESEEQTCATCSCCQRPQLTETSHHVTVNIVDEEILMQIEPLVFPKTSCGSCDENTGCPSSDEPPEVQFTVTNTMLLSYEELTEQARRAISFILTEIAVEDLSARLYGLSYKVEHEEYDFALYTSLSPLDTQTYSASFTAINYAPTDKSGLTSVEFVEFNSSVTLSEQFAVLGKVAKRMGNLYEKSQNVSIQQLASSYYGMQEEIHYLSKFVKGQLTNYDNEILKPGAILTDGYAQCGVACGIAMGIMCGAMCAPLLGWFCAGICPFVVATICSVICGNPPNLCRLGCSVMCAAVSAPCGWVGFLCALVCNAACWQIIPPTCG